MYFTDLSEYCYQPANVNGLVNVGWLDKSHSYETGLVSPDLIDRLLLLASEFSVNRTRGLHSCPFCEQRYSRLGGVGVRWRGRLLVLGGAEIRVPGEAGINFAAPDLVAHYIQDHNYSPPVEFQDALQSLDPRQFTDWVGFEDTFSHLL